MAIRRLNYTGRKRIGQNDARITICESASGPSTFEAGLRLQNYGLPAEAQVFVEAYRQTSWMRFAFGTVGTTTSPDDRRLAEFDNIEAVLFRVRVTSGTEPRGLLLAEADRIRPRRPEEREEERIPILPVKPDADLREEVFRVDFNDAPVLLVNSRTGDWRAAVRQPAFVSLVFPAVVREILTRILCIEQYFETEDSQDWKSHWLRYASLLPGMPELPEEHAEAQINDWIDDAVASFCRKYHVMERFGQYWSGEGEA